MPSRNASTTLKNKLFIDNDFQKKNLLLCFVKNFHTTGVIILIGPIAWAFNNSEFNKGFVMANLSSN